MSLEEQAESIRGVLDDFGVPEATEGGAKLSLSGRVFWLVTEASLLRRDLARCLSLGQEIAQVRPPSMEEIVVETVGDTEAGT